MFLNFFLLMENLGAMADSRYTGFREITDRDVLDLYCIQGQGHTLTLAQGHSNMNIKTCFSQKLLGHL